MAARPGGAERLRREEGRGGRGHWEAEAEAESRGGEARRASPQGRRKEPKGESEGEARRKEPKAEGRETGRDGKSRGWRWGCGQRGDGKPREPEMAEEDQDGVGGQKQGTATIRKEPKETSEVGGRRRN